MATALFDEKTIERLRRLRLAAGRVRRAASRGERVSRHFGTGQEFGGHRPYAHGDDLRHVDWNVYGRLDQLVLKLFEAPGRLRLLLVLDDSPTMDFGEPSKWLAARRALAAIGLVALAGAERLLTATLGGGPIHTFEGGAAEQRLLATLAEIPLADSTPSLNNKLLELLGTRGRDTVMILASDFQHREPCLALLREARRRGVRAAALGLFAQQELEPSLSGFTQLQPIGGVARKLRIDERILAAYRDEVQNYRKAVAHTVQGLGASYVEVDAADAVEPLMADLSRIGMLETRR